MRKSVIMHQLPLDIDLTSSDGIAQLNSILGDHGDRIDTVQQIGVRKPPSVTGLAVTGKQGCIWLVWNRIKNIDGYIVIGASTADMSKVAMRFNLPDADQCTHSVAVGNVATTYYFTVSAYVGNQISKPSTVVSGVSLAFTTSESAPPVPPFDPRGSGTLHRNGLTLG